MLVTALLVAALTILGVSMYQKSKRVAIVLDGELAVNAVKAHLGDYELKTLREDEERSLRARLCSILFECEEVSLPLIVLLEGGELRGVIAGLPSDDLWKAVLDRLSTESRAFLAFSGPERLLMRIKCYQCPPHGLVEEIVELSSEETREILNAVKEVGA